MYIPFPLPHTCTSSLTRLFSRINSLYFSLFFVVIPTKKGHLHIQAKTMEIQSYLEATRSASRAVGRGLQVERIISSSNLFGSFSILAACISRTFHPMRLEQAICIWKLKYTQQDIKTHFRSHLSKALK